MNRIVKHLTGMAAVLGVAGVLLAAGPVRAAKGPSPQSETATVTVTIPPRVGIRLTDHPTSLQPGNDYPPDTFPYWVVPGAYQIEVFSNKNNFQVTVQPSAGSWPAGLDAQSFYVVTWGGAESTYTGQGNPSDPSSDLTGWMQLGSSPVNVVGDNNGRSRTNGWESYQAKLALKLDGDEEETSVPVTFTYTISTI